MHYRSVGLIKCKLQSEATRQVFDLIGAKSLTHAHTVPSATCTSTNNFQAKNYTLALQKERKKEKTEFMQHLQDQKFLWEKLLS